MDTRHMGNGDRHAVERGIRGTLALSVNPRAEAEGARL